MLMIGGALAMAIRAKLLNQFTTTKVLRLEACGAHTAWPSGGSGRQYAVCTYDQLAACAARAGRGSSSGSDDHPLQWSEQTFAREAEAAEWGLGGSEGPARGTRGHGD
jgi:hypothetical protein